MRDAVLAGLKAEFDNVLKQQTDLNREMMLLPIERRCRLWMEYYRRLNELMKRQQRIEAVAAILNHHPVESTSLSLDRSSVADVNIVALNGMD